MKIKFLNNLTLVFNSILYVIIGVLIIIWPKYMIDSLFIIVVIAFVLKSITNLSYSILAIQWHKFVLNIIYLLIEVAFIIFLLKEENIFYSIFDIVFGAYIILDAIIRLLCFVISYKYDIRKALFYLICSFISFTISFLILFQDMSYVTFVLVGMYFILYGFAYFKDFVSSVFKYRKRITRVSLPVIIALITPYLAYRKIVKSKHHPKNIIKNGKQPNLYISFHVGPKLISKPGHIDICYNDEIISFGQYDKENLRFFKIFGDGVMYTVKNKDKYYQFVKEKDQKIIFEYGLYLTDEEALKVEHKISELKNNTIPWSSKLEYTYAYKLEHQLNAKLYKFKSGEFKNYFSPRNNCVFLADAIMKTIDIDNLSLGSFIIPGSYFNYFDEQLKIKSSNIITKKIYI